ncbi:hypothetical protein GCK32_005957, partial [Trichostrongylus colubriformis]
MSWKKEFSELLEFLDECTSKYPNRLFNVIPEKDSTPVRRVAFAFENIVDQLKKPLVPSTQSLAQALVYKFNGPHRRQGYWMIYKNLSRALRKYNEDDLLLKVSDLHKKVTASGAGFYMPSVEALRYVVGAYLKRLFRLQQIRDLCIRTAHVIMGQLELGHWEKFSLFIVALCADVNNGIRTQAASMEATYDGIARCLEPLDNRFPKSLAELSVFLPLRGRISSQKNADISRVMRLLQISDEQLDAVRVRDQMAQFRRPSSADSGLETDPGTSLMDTTSEHGEQINSEEDDVRRSKSEKKRRKRKRKNEIECADLSLLSPISATPHADSSLARASTKKKKRKITPENTLYTDFDSAKAHSTPKRITTDDILPVISSDVSDKVIKKKKRKMSRKTSLINSDMGDETSLSEAISFIQNNSSKVDSPTDLSIGRKKKKRKIAVENATSIDHNIESACFLSDRIPSTDDSCFKTSKKLKRVPNLHYYIEAALVATIVYLYVYRKQLRTHHHTTLTEKQKDQLIAEWQPEPLVPDTPQDHPALNPRFADGKMCKYVRIDGKEYLNMATSNFLGFVGEKRIEVCSLALFRFMGCEEAVLYSYGFATIASAIPAYAKRNDVIFVDKGVNFAIQKGLQASRSRIEWFDHNDVSDLERLLKEQEIRDKKDPKKAAKIRRFIVVEGLYANTADLCPLPRIMELKWKYKVRVFIDESWSFGVIGNTGKG